MRLKWKQNLEYTFGMVALAFFLSVLFCNRVYAVDNAILETQTGENDVTLFVRGIDGNTDNIKVQIGTTVCDQVVCLKISESEIPMQTLIMLDNSLSIPDKDRHKIAEILQNVISDRLPGEEISIATFDEKISYCTQFTSDYSTLKGVIDSLAYNDQETYLTDVLYEVLTDEYKNNQNGIFQRIMIISDGVDNKSIGYTKEELYNLIKEVKIPLYTIGCKTKNNNEQLENMFALSRMTSVSSFLLSEMDDVLIINEALNTDREIYKVVVTPPPALLDGSKKTVKIEAGVISLSMEATMPQQEEINEVDEEPAKEVVVTESKKESAPVQTIQEEQPEETGEQASLLSVGIIVGAIILLIILVIAIVCIIRKTRKENKFEGISQKELDEIDRELKYGSEESNPTEILGPAGDKQNSDGATQFLWSDSRSYQIVLTDVNSPARSFQKSITSSLIIGRKREFCDIVIDFDKSVSGKHCKISTQNGKFFIEDLQSANGTQINKSSVFSKTEIYTGNVITLGRVELRFEVR